MSYIYLSISTLAKEERSKNSDEHKVKDKIIFKFSEKLFINLVEGVVTTNQG